MALLYSPEVLAQIDALQQRAIQGRRLADYNRLRLNAPAEYTPGKYPNAIIPNPLTQAIQGYLTYHGLKQEEGAETDRQRAVSDAEQSRRDQLYLMNAPDTGEIRARIARAAASSDPVVRESAAAMEKMEFDRQKQAWEQRKDLSGALGKVDAPGAYNMLLDGRPPEQAPSWKMPTVSSIPDPTRPGGQMAQITNYAEGGRPQATFQQPGVNVTNNLGPKANQFLLEKAIGPVMAEGKSFADAQASASALTRIKEVVGAIDRGAQTGLVEPYAQAARGILDFFNIKTDANAPTAVLSSQMKSLVLDERGGLGAQISDADRKFFTEATGDIATNPEALKRILAVMARSSLKKIADHNARVNALLRNQTAELDPTILQQQIVPAGLQLPDTQTGRELDQMLQNLYSGKSTGKVTPSLSGPALRDFYLKGGR